MITKKHKTPLYGTEFTIIIYDTLEELKEHFDDDELTDKVYLHQGAVFTYQGHLYIVFCSAEEGYPTPGLIAHEAKHLVNEIFIEIHHKLSRHNDEPEAYLLSWIVNRIHELLNKK